MIYTQEVFGFTLTDEFGGPLSCFTDILTQEEIDFLESEEIENEHCIIGHPTVERQWLVIGIYPGNSRENEATLIETIAKSSPMIQEIHKKIMAKFHIEYENMTLYGEI